MKKYLAILFIFVVLLQATIAPALARNPVPNGGAAGDYQETVFNPAIDSQDVNLQSTVYEIFLSLIASMNRSTLCYAQTEAQAKTDCKRIIFKVTDTGTTSPYANAGGIIPELLSINTSLLKSHPVSSTQYMAYVSDKLNIGVQPAYAQGIGYTGLLPILQIWQAFRNIAYLVATIGFVVLSFMIMFRIRAGQSVINAQAAITKFIFVIIAITFSYAIAGFIIDLIYVFCGLVISLFIGSGLLGTNLATAQANLLSGNVFSMYATLTGINSSAGPQVSKLVDELFNAFDGSVLATFIGAIFSWGIGGIIRLVIGIAIIYSLFKLFIQLLFAYLQILLLTIMGPLMILMDILPGGNSFYSWMRSLFAHAMIFPSTVFVFIVGIIIVGGQNNFGLAPTTTIPLDSQGLQLPFLTVTAGSLAPILGIGFILIAPRVNDMVKKAFQVSSFQYSSEIGAALGVGIAGTRGFVDNTTALPRGVGGYVGRRYADTQLAQIGERFQDSGGFGRLSVDYLRQRFTKGRKK